MSRIHGKSLAALVAFSVLPTSSALAGGTAVDATLSWARVAVGASSGTQRGQPQEERLAWYSLVQSPEASWIRLEFGPDSSLAAALDASQSGSYIRITSLEDGAEQVLDAQGLAQWHHTSAYFNGSAVIVELITGRNAAANVVSIASAQVGEDQPMMRSQCGADDRTPSADPRVGRIVPVGCTGWIVDDANHMLLSAGHCPAGGGFSVLQFNVPRSNSNGTIVNPPPEDQYAIDASSVQFANGGIGNDWCYFGVFPNSNTGLTPFRKQQASFRIGTPPVAGATLRVTGFGAAFGTLNQTNQTSVGPLSASSESTSAPATLQYAVDTNGGNSGSPLILEGQGTVVGIHTHAGCTLGGGANNGTSIALASLQAALANPQGVCKPMTFDFPAGLPAALDSAGGQEILMTATSPAGASAPAAVKMLWKYEGDASASAIDGVLVSGTTYRFVTPAFDCGERVLYGFSARMGAAGGMGTWPASLPRQWISAPTSSLDLVLWADDFETDRSWATSAQDATDGFWVRGTPYGGGFQGDPLIDADGSGRCFVTGNIEGSSVLNGSVTLTSPPLDATMAINPTIAYARWFANLTNSIPDQGTMTVELSSDDGQTWVEVETVGPAGTTPGWVTRTVSVLDHVDPSSTLRVRFTVRNTDPANVVEAGVDAVRLLADNALGWCGPMGDFNNDGVVDGQDLGILLLQWGLGGITDLDGDGITDAADLGLLLLSYTG
jgi:hypothetical protein